jgi:isoquinoline 1-oxidoreductase subunit beta
VKLSRRRFLKVGLSSGALLTVAAYLGTGGEKSRPPSDVWREHRGRFAPNAWVSVGTDESVIVRIHHTEMGQGITTGLARIVAEELDADWKHVRVEIAPVDVVYKNPDFNCQMTAASTSVKTSWEPLRRAGAAARQMLVTAAALRWNVPATDCCAENGGVLHAATGRRLSYGSLVEAAAKLPVPEDAALKSSAHFTLIGRPIPRLDTAEKIRGAAMFGIDVRMPGLLQATIVHPPVFGSRVETIDAGTVAGQTGVRTVLKISTGVAVVADTYWQAKVAADQLQIQWAAGEGKAVSSEELNLSWAELCRASGKTVYRKGDAANAFARASKTIQAAYVVPFQAHATPEPMNCTAHVQRDRCDIWAPTQSQDAAREAAARITGLDYDRISVHTPFVGGGFGRRMTVDYVVEAVEISKALQAPVKVIWSREEDIQNDVYRPGSHALLEAAVSLDGLPSAWRHRIVGPDHMAHQLPGMIPGMLPYGVPRALRNAVAAAADVVLPRIVPGKKVIEGAAPLPYALENVAVEHINEDPGIPLGFWRSVAFSQNIFFVESFLDEIAFATGQDPLELRLRLLDRTSRLAEVIRRVGEAAQWGDGRREAVQQGLAAYDFHGTHLAMIAETSVEPSGCIRVQRMICAVDCGVVINPRLVVAQIEGGIAFGLTAALKGKITFTKGRVDQSNFHDYPLLRLNEMPEVEVHLTPSAEAPSGIGESAVPLVAPAVANAVFKGTGRRLRELPLRI